MDLQKKPLSIEKALFIQGWMEPAELYWLAEKASTHHRIVEVGSFLGRSTTALAENTPGWVLAFDDWKGPRDADITVNVRAENNDILGTEKRNFDQLGIDFFTMFVENVRPYIENNKVRMLVADHAKVEAIPIEFLRGPDSEKPDMVFIDGHHGYDECKRDILIWKARLAKGGLLCGHDLDHDGVWRAVTEEFPDSWLSVPYTNLWLIRTV